MATANMTVEERLGRIETRLDSFEKNFATKADLANLKAWMVVTMVALQLTGLAAIAAIVRWVV